MKIRPATPDDVEALVPLFEHWGHPHDRDGVVEILDQWQDLPHGALIVADDCGDIVGMAAVVASPRLADAERNAHLQGLVVARHRLRTGVASMLLTAAEDMSRKWGCVRLELTTTRTRDAAQHFYRARGYRETSSRQERFVREFHTKTVDPMD
ncbi:GNAT family N-acetyltransferase [Amycolatopsis sp. QT-25]|uniref:GNAT family N-acetyltransferase n=1 Tax=Amycolatopsis sp. QT-25 TaxID=3034022 RepID=UPI0023ED7D1E|nr:GNAT family N-acetyltransferase [Amycolatopsis sp. QT-25]WET76338.1 GNAT family N-acetyltransferase [Amycolatopsis sp. QT-25]